MLEAAIVDIRTLALHLTDETTVLIYISILDLIGNVKYTDGFPLPSMSVIKHKTMQSRILCLIFARY